LNETSNQIFKEQVRLLYANSSIPIAVSVAAAGLLCYSLKTVTPHYVLFSWFSALLLVSVVRLFLTLSYKKKLKYQDYWHSLFLIGIYASGVTWGSSAFLMFPEQSLSHQIVFFMIIMGVAAGGISSLCSSLSVVISFLSLLLMPVMLKKIILGSPETLFNASLVLIFWAVLMIGAIRIHNNIQENILLRIQSITREQFLKVSEERYRHIFSSAPLGIFHYDANGVIIDCNEAFVSLINTSKNLIVGVSILEKLKDEEMLSAVNKSLNGEEGYYEGDYISIAGNTAIPVRTFFKAIKQQDEVIGGVGIVEDYTEKKKSAELIRYQASYDHLTGLSNRRLLIEQLREELSRASRHEHYGAILFIDLDNFKTINDSLGHSMGDELLKVISKRITDNLRKEDTAARMGGDEFVIIATELGQATGVAAYRAKGIAEKIMVLLSTPCRVKGHNLSVTASIGVSLFPEHGKTADDILKQADSAMYRAKEAGCNMVRFFLPHMQDTANERLLINMEIRNALEFNQFVLYYQPQVNEEGLLVGAEALLRWDHPEKGILLPGTFLEIAEDTGSMQAIGQWVLREACLEIRSWTDAGMLSSSQTISVNISGKELMATGFLEETIKIIEETGVDPNRLGIELTESSLVPSGEDIVQRIMVLQNMGVKFSVDDFGTGYSSLSYLKQLPLNTLKIDRTFVNDIKDGSQGVTIVDTIISLARNLGLAVVAEGVETEQELHYLNSKGCKIHQGYYFSKPLPVEKFCKLLGSKGLKLP